MIFSPRLLLTRTIIITKMRKLVIHSSFLFQGHVCYDEPLAGLLKLGKADSAIAVLVNLRNDLSPFLVICLLLLLKLRVAVVVRVRR